jgi:N-acetylmuramoyl-L-alanine amidase
VIDAGHGGEDGGACTYEGLPEKDLNLFIAKDLELMLRLCGINVVMTRTDDRLLYDPQSDYKGHKKSMDLASRLKTANETPNAILVSIHMNAFPESKYCGLQVYYSDRSNGGLKLAQMIQNTYKDRLMPSNTRKAKAAGSNIYLLHRFDGVGVLVECGFLSNESEREKLNTAEYRSQIAACLLESIVEYISSCNY